MELWHFVWVLTALTGLAVAGIAGSGWALLTGERPHIRMLDHYSPATPFRVLALVCYAPLAVTRAGLGLQADNPMFNLLLFALGLVWSFLQGVFILTTFFGFT